MIDNLEVKAQTLKALIGEAVRGDSYEKVKELTDLLIVSDALEVLDYLVSGGSK